MFVRTAMLNPNQAPRAIPAVPHVWPQVIVGPNLPLGGSYGDVLSYFVERGRPTYQFSDMPVEMALVAVELWAYLPGAIMPCVYVFLDASLISECWYYVYRYVNPLAPPAPTTGAVGGSPGPLGLISQNVALPANEGIFLAVLPPSLGAVPPSGDVTYYPSSTSLLRQVSLGVAPIIEPPWWTVG